MHLLEDKVVKCSCAVMRENERAQSLKLAIGISLVCILQGPNSELGSTFPHCSLIANATHTKRFDALATATPAALPSIHLHIRVLGQLATSTGFDYRTRDCCLLNLMT